VRRGVQLVKVPHGSEDLKGIIQNMQMPPQRLVERIMKIVGSTIVMEFPYILVGVELGLRVKPHEGEYPT
jgi:hypothetical protein